MMSVLDGLQQADGKPQGDGPKGREDMRIAARGLRDFPFEETALSASAAVMAGGVLFTAGHGGFVGGDDFVGGTVLADVAVVNPDDAMAEAANLVELMGDEDDGAAGAGNVAHFAE